MDSTLCTGLEARVIERDGCMYLQVHGRDLSEHGYASSNAPSISLLENGTIVIRPEQKGCTPNQRYVYLHMTLGENDRPSIKTPRDAYDLVSHLGSSDRERFHALYLDSKNCLNGIHEVSVGTLTASLVHPREVYKPAILMNSAAVLLAHNHPSGDPTPSQEDISITKRLTKAGELLGIEVLDHIIIGHGTYESMRESGYL